MDGADPATSIDSSPTHGALIEWLHRNGAVMPTVAAAALTHPAFVDTEGKPSVEYGMVAAKSSKAGETLVKIPQQLLITDQLATAFWESVLKEREINLSTSGRFNAEALLELWLLSELQLGSNSFWAPFLATLPPLEYYAPYWKGDMILQDTVVLPQHTTNQSEWEELGLTNMATHFKEVYKTVARPVIETFPSQFPVDHFSEEAFVRMAMVVKSHTTRVNSTHRALVPVLANMRRKAVTGHMTHTIHISSDGATQTVL